MKRPGLSGDEAAVDEVEAAGHEAGGVAGEEMDEFGDFAGFADTAQRVAFGFGFPVGAGVSVVGDVGEFLEKVFRQRGFDGAGADGVCTYAAGAEVDGEAAGDLADGAFGQAVGEAVGLADVALVGCVDDDAAAAFEVGDGKPQGVDGSHDVGADHEVEFFVADVEQGVAAMDAGVGDDAVESAEGGEGLFDRAGDLFLVFDVARVEAYA